MQFRELVELACFTPVYLVTGRITLPQHFLVLGTGGTRETGIQAVGERCEHPSVTLHALALGVRAPARFMDILAGGAALAAVPAGPVLASHALSRQAVGSLALLGNQVG